jgi:hypothetical protein
MPTTLSKEDQAAFSEGLSGYQYITEEGSLDLENFCVTLAACIHHDGVGLEKVARPESFHTLLLNIIAESSPEQERLWVQSQRIMYWTPQHSFLYPEGHRTCIHVAALISYSAEWISLIGSDVLHIPDEECRPEYFGWAQEGWHFTHAFLSGYHHALFSFVKKMDLKWSSEGSVSKFEALQLTYREHITFEAATQKLSLRNQAWLAATIRIEKAISDGYYLEAISLNENFMSHLLFNFLSSKGSATRDFNFNSLIQKARPYFVEVGAADLIESVDLWRRRRNDAIHNFISSSIDDLTSNTDTLTATSSDTAASGASLAKLMLEWYRAAAVNFIEHNFRRSQLDS